ncbi:M48 family metalloprotease [Leptospira sp. 96542]|nr:M48 family metalloprotease [Leptospira sp. 96542]
MFLYVLSALFLFSILARGNLYVQSTKARLLSQPKLSVDGANLQLGEVLSPITEQGLFVQVRYGEQTGWVSKLFVSPLPPGNQIQLGVTSKSTEAVLARQRASEFTKTAAARGLSESQKMRIRGEGEIYDFDSLRWLESIPYRRDKVQNKIPAKEITYPLEVLPETKAEVKLGRALAARILKKYVLIKDDELTKYLNEVTSRIVLVSSRPDLDFKVGVLDSDEINAFACPGGFIFITKGALQKVHSESELAGVISHEVGHIVLFHNGEFKENNIYIDVVANLLNPSGGEVINSATSALLSEFEKQLFETGRDSEKELQADEAAVGLATAAGYSPNGLGNYLNSISKISKTDGLKRTHPETTIRIAKLVYIEAQTNVEASSSFTDRWHVFKTRIAE